MGVHAISTRTPVGAILSPEARLRSIYLGIIPLLSGCWKVDANTLDVQDVPYEPTAEVAPAGWVIHSWTLPVTCPDGEASNLYALYPKDAVGPLPTAILFHSGAFDYVDAPSDADPISGPHYASPELRLEREWAVRRTFATLGLQSDPDPQEHHTGALPIALAEAGVAVLLPANCWGDMWHGAQTPVSRVNDPAEFIERRGFEAASFAWEVSQGTAAVQLPFQIDRSKLYLLGQGEGGRAVTELLRDGAKPAGILLDSTADDLGAYWDNLDVYANRITGLERIWPAGAAATQEGALAWATNAQLPAKVAYVYSSLDSRIPLAAHNPALATLTASGADVFERDVAVSRHVATAGDLALSREVVGYLVGN